MGVDGRVVGVPLFGGRSFGRSWVLGAPLLPCSIEHLGGVVDVRQHRFALRGRRVLVGLGDELGDVERHDHRQGAPWRQNHRVGVVAHGAGDELAEGVGLP